MRNKKLFSTVMATTLAVTTMAMPVMAQGGKVDVTVTNKDGILRVEVPTKMAVEIDPFEIAQKGCQIACVEEFEMTNRSQMDVKVAVTSTVGKASGVSLVSSKQTAVKSTTAGEAWLAVAAKTSGDAYADGTENDYWELTENNANVTTFSASGDASQTFYLGQASGDAQNEVYTQVVPTVNSSAGVAYAQFYELAKDSSISGDAALKAAVAENDIYVAKSGDADKDKAELTKFSKGDSTAAYTAGDVCYTVSGDAALEEKDLKANTTYMYSALDTKGGEAGFRYVGNLSSANSTAWSNKDITGITINYDITGVSKSDYEVIKDQCTYGLYAPVTGPKLSVSNSGLISVSGLLASNNFDGNITITDEDGLEKTAADVELVWDADDWTQENGGDFTVQMPQSWVSYWSGKKVTVKVGLLDMTNLTAEITF